MFKQDKCKQGKPFRKWSKRCLAALVVGLIHTGVAFADSPWSRLDMPPSVCTCAICTGLTSLVINNEPAADRFALHTAAMPAVAPDAGLTLSSSPPLVAGSGAYTPIASNSDNLGSFTININAGAALAGNAPALAAFQRAALQWADFISDPITVNVDANLANLGSPTTIGTTSSVGVQGSYDSIVNLLRVDGAAEADDGLVASLPTFAQFTAVLPAGFTLNGNAGSTKANLKAIDQSFDFDAQFGVSDGTITFNTQFNFDYDNSDGVSPGTVDFETVAAHEIGHLLGFVSEVDRIDVALSNSQTVNNVNPRLLDLFRFNDDQVGGDPSNLSEFTTFPRRLSPGGDHIADFITAFAGLPAELELSTGRNTGDGRQASHWRDNALSGLLIGIMDPTLPNQTVIPVGLADLRALDLIGYDINIPEPASGALLLAGGVLLLRRRRTSRA